jgi:hypothetical protein
MSVRPTSRTLGDLLDEMAAKRPHADALAFRGEQISYAGLQARVNHLAHALIAAGVTRGDRVAVLLPNCPEWVVGALAIAKVGGIVSAISTFSTSRELGWTLEHSSGGAHHRLSSWGRAIWMRSTTSVRAGGQRARGPSEAHGCRVSGPWCPWTAVAWTEYSSGRIFSVWGPAEAPRRCGRDSKR